MRMYVYKLTVDNGGAPCVSKGLLSLAICKPMIRKSAPKNSWIFGFAGDELRKTHPNNRLIYVAQVNDIVPGCHYYADNSEYRERADCIYKATGTGFSIRKDARHHKGGGEMAHDLGTIADQFDRAKILVSEHFQYFGRDGDELLPSTPRLMELLDRLRRGHRTNIDDATRAELETLKDLAFDCQGLAASPTEPAPAGSKCGQSCEETFATDDECVCTS